MSATALEDRPESRTGTAAALAQVRRDVLEVGARRLALVAHWADLHPFTDAVPSPVASAVLPVLPGRPGARRVGADGIVEVGEFAADELGVLLGIHTHAAQALLADAVNLRDRHPLLWARVQDHQVPDWVAIKAARTVAAAGLVQHQARWVDQVTSGYAATLTPGRFLALVEAKTIEADPAAAQARAQAAALDRFVRTGQSNQHGLKTLVARATAGQIIYLVAVIDRLAQILALQGDTDPADLRRSKALAILATPAHALHLLAWAEAQPKPELDLEPETEPHSGRNDPDLNAAIATSIASADPAKLRPPATLYLHLSHESWATAATRATGATAGSQGVARMENVGPITIEQAREFLGHSHITITPVLDLAGGMPVDCYEIPDRMHHTITLRHPHEIFPWATHPARGTDTDHTRPWRPPDHGGPPAQTHPDKLGPLTRRHHRLKTHAPGWQHHQISPGVHLWATPTGHWTRVDRHGTHPLGTGTLGPDISIMEQHLAALIGA